MRSLLDSVTASDIRLDPFAHIVIPDVMDMADYADLAASFPGFARMAWQGHAPSNRRFLLNAATILAADDLPDCWKRFAARHTSPAFLQQVASLFAGCWPEALMKTLGGSFGGHDTALLNPFEASADDGGIRLRLDARLEINTPVLVRPSSARGPHLDTPNRLYSGLFYMRTPEDDSIGGELILYRWRRPPDTRHYQLPADDVTEVARIPYRANQLVLFPQSIDALHGVGLRHPTPHTRRYVFITAEINRNWLTAPTPQEGAE
jgi:hypothetical protein